MGGITFSDFNCKLRQSETGTNANFETNAIEFSPKKNPRRD